MEAPYRPVALRVMAEWGEQDPAWDSDLDHMGSVELTELGVSAELIEQLRAWNEQFNALGWSDYRWPDDEQERAWQDEGCAWPTSCPTSRSAMSTTVTTDPCGDVAVPEPRT